MVSKKTLCCGAAVIVVAVVIIVPSVLLTQKDPDPAAFKETFLERCLEFPEKRDVCETSWLFFEEAYVGKDRCSITAGNYAPLFDLMPFKHPCAKTMFWSKTSDLVHNFTEKGDCLFTLEDTLLGYLMNGLSWCGKVGSTETFTKDCEGCPLTNPVFAFWEMASSRFALHACEEASVMLDGERTEPYDPNSFFGRVEVPNIQPSHVTTLTVVLVTPEDGRNCTCDSLGSLRKDLDFRIGCSCTAVAKSHIEKCIENNNTCGTCW